MKKPTLLLAVILFLGIFALSAEATSPGTGAYYINVQTDGFNNDPQTQAEMLKKLWLLRGTDKGFELERPMTRAEAAVMFVQFLGAEEKVLAGTWKHPFRDVPEWADKYIGWLYQSGLTKGVSATKYGAQQAVTIRQYAGLLARALLGPDAAEDSWTYCATEDEAKLCESNGCFNRDAAGGLSVRALSLRYTAYGNPMTMAQLMVNRGMFTAEQFDDASREVLPSTYYPPVEEGGKKYITRYVAEVPVARCIEDGLTLAGGTEYSKMNYLPASRILPDGTVEFFILDAKTLDILASDRCQTDGSVSQLTYIGSVFGGSDYLVEERADENGGSLGVGDILCWNGKKLSRVITRNELWQEGEPSNANSAYAYNEGAGRIESCRGYRQTFTNGNLLVAGKDTLFYFMQDGMKQSPYPAGTQLFALSAEGSLVAQRVTSEKTVISCIDAQTGATLDEYTVLPDMEGNAGQRTISLHDYSHFYGEAGLYEFFDGRLDQLTGRPVLSAAATNEGWVILTHAPVSVSIPQMASAVTTLCCLMETEA
ncbi:hypothetical protein Psch_01476 [Pelotomaculum schinkii]|uniref:SLH domain-containing protein n=2 Tax=Pelotomaculum schinkii TaxID=78350 RepID=A0A4Y7RGL3_9FIRM|nr:hypothetical protein Psch_01476 [Pelotomaculum schinkii]